MRPATPFEHRLGTAANSMARFFVQAVAAGSNRKLPALGVYQHDSSKGEYGTRPASIQCPGTTDGYDGTLAFGSHLAADHLVLLEANFTAQNSKEENPFDVGRDLDLDCMPGAQELEDEIRTYSPRARRCLCNCNGGNDGTQKDQNASHHCPIPRRLSPPQWAPEAATRLAEQGELNANEILNCLAGMRMYGRVRSLSGIIGQPVENRNDQLVHALPDLSQFSRPPLQALRSFARSMGEVLWFAHQSTTTSCF